MLVQEQVVAVQEAVQEQVVAVQEAGQEQEREPFVGLSPGQEAELGPVGNPSLTTAVSYCSRLF